jgi:ElaB/YqjD/DUF883 family membrane-anchored ribosome-binding protein
MDEAPRTEGSRMINEERTQAEPRPPAEIQRDIEETREELGDTAEALAQKADVKGQAKARAEDIRQRAQEKLRQSTPESASAGASQVATTARENPMPVAVASAFAAGVVVGWLLAR